jgi:hypothetical protein
MALADAGLTTTDMALAASTGAAFVAAVLWAEKPSRHRALLLGIFTALALLSKSSSIGYLALSTFLAALCYIVGRRVGWRQFQSAVAQRYKTFLFAIAVSGFLIWAAYWFSFGPVEKIGFSLPAPEYFNGLIEVLRHNRYGHGAFLLGQHRFTGWWYYFPVALGVKTPIAFLVLIAIGIAVSVARRAQTAYLLPLAFSFGVLLPAMAGHVNIGIRHISPIYLSLSIVAALGVMELLQTPRFRVLSGLTAVVLVAWMIVSVAKHHPDYLSYFNGFAGKHPEKILADSNYDWGQDLKFLATRLHQLHADHVTLGSLDSVFSVDYKEAWYGLPEIREVNDAVPSPGWTAISASYRLLVKKNVPSNTTWYDRIPPTERLGPFSLYYAPPKPAASSGR